jgi:hypothetical protein
MASPSHEAPIGGTERGCLVICDVSGYSEYLHSVELEHAQDVLADLTETIVDRLRPTFHLSKLEGDAAFVYGLESEIEASKLFDTIEDTYFAFRARVRDIDHATSCDCDACRRIPQLDLKVVTHFGRFARQRIAGSEELTGPDVILVHRLLKNTVAERIDSQGYALHTRACVDALGVDPARLELTEHREAFDDVGEVECYVDDLAERWRYESERRRVFVVPDDAEFEVVQELPVPVPVVWEWLTDPQKRAMFQGSVDRIDEDLGAGRRGVGTVNHCVHGRGTTLQRFVDWRPFRYFTIENDAPVIGPWAWTFELVRVDDDTTRVHMRGARLEGLKQRAAWFVMRRPLMKEDAADWERLRALLEPSTEPVGV